MPDFSDHSDDALVNLAGYGRSPAGQPIADQAQAELTVRLLRSIQTLTSETKRGGDLMVKLTVAIAVMTAVLLVVAIVTAVS